MKAQQICFRIFEIKSYTADDPCGWTRESKSNRSAAFLEESRALHLNPDTSELYTSVADRGDRRS